MASGAALRAGGAFSGEAADSGAAALLSRRRKLLIEIRWLYIQASSPERKSRRIYSSGKAWSLRSSTIIKPAIE